MGRGRGTRGGHVREGLPGLDLMVGVLEPRTGDKLETGDKVQPLLKEDPSGNFMVSGGEGGQLGEAAEITQSPVLELGFTGEDNSMRGLRGAEGLLGGEVARR